MQKRKILFWALFLCLAFSACSRSVDNVFVESGNTTETSEDMKLGNEKQDDFVDIRLLTIETLEEYKEHIASLPDSLNFVTYEMLGDIGEFKTFVCLSNAYSGDYSQYMYVLRDDSGAAVDLYVEPWVEKAPDEFIMSTSAGNNLRELGTSQTGTVKHNNLEYSYAKGDVFSVSWRQGNHRLTLGLPKDYPDDVATTFAGKLLSAETAQATIASLPIFEAVE